MAISVARRETARLRAFRISVERQLLKRTPATRQSFRLFLLLFWKLENCDCGIWENEKKQKKTKNTYFVRKLIKSDSVHAFHFSSHSCGENCQTFQSEKAANANRLRTFVRKAFSDFSLKLCFLFLIKINGWNVQSAPGGHRFRVDTNTVKTKRSSCAQ